MGFILKARRKAGYSLSVCVFFWGMFLSSPSQATLDPARKAGMVPHKALYNISLISKKSSAKISNIKGKMAYEWQSTCDAWVSSHQFDMTYEYVEAPSMRVTSDFSTYESFDGKSFSFTSQRKREGAVFEEIRGIAESGNSKPPAEVVYTIPEDIVFNLPEGTLFPIAHTLDVLEKIKKGQRFYKATLFDGSDTEGPVDVNSFIGKETHFVVPAQYADFIDQEIVDTKAWKIRLAFFPLSKPQETSDYEMSVIFHENGVITSMEVDYHDFSIVQELVALEKTKDICDVQE